MRYRGRRKRWVANLLDKSTRALEFLLLDLVQAQALRHIRRLLFGLLFFMISICFSVYRYVLILKLRGWHSLTK